MSIVRAAIRTAEDRYPNHPVGGAQGYVDEWWQRYQGDRPVGVGMAIGASVTPLVNHGRWIVMCPDSECHSSQWASKRDPRFMCVECANWRAGFLWIRVEWPADTDQIELLLGARPNRHTRHWLIGEPVEHLVEENHANGVR